MTHSKGNVVAVVAYVAEHPSLACCTPLAVMVHGAHALHVDSHDIARSLKEPYGQGMQLPSKKISDGGSDGDGGGKGSRSGGDGRSDGGGGKFATHTHWLSVVHGPHEGMVSLSKLNQSFLSPMLLGW